MDLHKMYASSEGVGVVKQLLHDIKINSNIISSDICEAQSYSLIYQALSMNHYDKLFY